MPRTRPSLDREAKEQHLLDAAESAFAEVGYDGASIAAIARACDVTATTVYWYFPSKDDLFAAVLRRWTAAEVVPLAAHPTSPALACETVATVTRELAPILADLHQRARAAGPVADALAELRERLVSLLTGSGVAPDEALAVLLFAEGVVSLGPAGSERLLRLGRRFI